MTQYFIQEEGNTVGPLSKEELENKKITKETWIWREGLEDWVQVKDLKELGFDRSLFKNVYIFLTVVIAITLLIVLLKTLLGTSQSVPSIF